MVNDPKTVDFVRMPLLVAVVIVDDVVESRAAAQKADVL